MSSRQLDEEEIFQTARLIDNPEARSRYLQQICAGDTALRDRVASLLEVHEKDEAFLKSGNEPAPTVDQPSLAEAPGYEIGRYRLLQRIGEGGFGVVFMAEQQRPIRRKVALKIIKPGMDTQSVIARFEAERQALALMDHQNIARVFDGGATQSGRPYFVMELVRGVPITEYCDTNQLSTAERLQLFVPVCQAVQHAHHKGIIHRDLKPSNILVTLHDGQPIIKVIDFGVAKAINQQLTEKTLFTAFGQMVGTPQYMSPEQAEMSALDVDTRSDVYSLGVLLYELLTGTTPLDRDRLQTAGYAEMQRIIREEEPPKPSVRLSSHGDKLTTLAKHRSSNPRGLRQSIRGELDWIVMKALEKDRSRRYETVSALALDIKNHLAGQPVLAGPPDSLYQLRKLLRRNRAAATTTGAVLLCLVGGILGTGWGLKQARDSLAEAVTAGTAAEESARRARAAQETAEENSYRADMQRAMNAVHEGNPREAERLLNRYGQAGRGGFEQRLLREVCLGSRPEKDLPLTGNPAAGDLSADGRWLAMCQTDGVFCLLDLQNQQKRQWSLGSQRRSWLTESFVSFAPDCHHVAYPSDDGRSIRIYDLETRTDDIFTGNGHTITSASFCSDPSNPWLATGDSSGSISLWDWRTRSVIAQEQHDGGVQVLDWSADGKTLVSGGETGLCVWDAQLTRLNAFRPAGLLLPLWIIDLAVSPSGKTFAECHGHSVSVWDTASGEPIATFTGHDAKVRAVRFISDTTLVSAGRDNVIRVWDLKTLREHRTLRGHSAYVWWLAGPSADGQFASGGLDGHAMVWGPDSPTEPDSILFDADQVRDVALSPDENLLAAVVQTWYPRRDQKSGVVLVGTKDFVRKRTLAVDYFVQSVAYSSDGVLACGGGKASSDEWESPGRITIWRSASDNEPRDIGDLPGRVQYVRFSSNGKSLAATCGRGCVVLSLPDGQWRQLSVGERGFDGLAWSPDGRYVAAGASDVDYTAPKLVVWDAQTGNEIFDTAGAEDHTESVHCLAFSPDGKLLASGGDDGQIQLRDVPSGHRASIIETHSGFIWSLVFSRDGRSLFSGSGDDTINIWDLDRRELRMSCPAHTDGTKAIVLSQDESWLVSGGLWDATLRMWRAPHSVLGCPTLPYSPTPRQN